MSTKPTGNLPDEFEQYERAARHLPPTGYAKEFQAAEQRGRAMMDAARNNERHFQPAREIVKP